MQTISSAELKEKLDRGDDFKLVMTMNEQAFHKAHIPGSLWATIQNVTEVVHPNEEIVVYCSNLYCPASIAAYQLLVRAGYAHVRRFAGGLAEWEAAGYSLVRG